MSALEFEAWPKTPRLNRDIVITEKIDGTNAAVVIVGASNLHARDVTGEGDWELNPVDAERAIAYYDGHVVFAQSRTRFITPEQDNHGFARWVKWYAGELVDTLGAGRHFGEWWGSGIQRGYGLTEGEKRFSLFNTARWSGEDLTSVPGLGVVPVLYQGPFNQDWVDECVRRLRRYGSQAAPEFMRPEGVIVWHDALRGSFKVTLEGDEKPKGLVAA